MNGDSIVLNDKTFDLYFERKLIKESVEAMASQINQDFEGKEIIVLGILDGAIMVLADLLKQLKVDVSLEMIKLKSYEGLSSTGQIHKLLGLTCSLEGKDVLVVEDIVDTGETLSFVIDLVKSHQPRSIKVATLLIKKEVFQNRYQIDYYGFSIPNKFVVGYGMDYDGHGRQLKHIYTLRV